MCVSCKGIEESYCWRSRHHETNYLRLEVRGEIKFVYMEMSLVQTLQWTSSGFLLIYLTVKAKSTLKIKLIFFFNIRRASEIKISQDTDIVKWRKKWPETMYRHHFWHWEVIIKQLKTFEKKFSKNSSTGGIIIGKSALPAKERTKKEIK